MSCILSLNFEKGCLDSVGGVKKFWISKHSDIDYTSTVETTGVITTLSPAVALATPFFSYEVQSESGLCEATSETNKQNGSTFWNHTATFPIPKMETTTRDELKALSAMGSLVIALDNNGAYWVYGYANGLNNAGIKSSTGTALGDKNGYDVSLAGAEPEDAKEIELAAFSALINT